MSPQLLEGFGQELELMIVDARTLNPLPLADRLLAAAALEPGASSDAESGDAVDDVEFGAFGWSNELVLHVIEFKTIGAFSSLENVSSGFQEQVALANHLLKPWGARLLPGALHPWLDPARDTRLWPHGHREIYAAYDRIFDCRGHGWCNLQSAHLNLSFADDDEFARLHAAVRVLLPLIPALAASSPVLEGQATGWLNKRLDLYRHNQERIPSIAGWVIPEPVWNRREYEERIFQRIWADIAPHDPEGLLRHEWLNSRGAIARYDRMALEIRLIDVQECPAADEAVAAAVVQALDWLIRQRWTPLEHQQSLSTEILAAQLWACARDGERARVTDQALLACFGVSQPLEAGALWREILAERPRVTATQSATLDVLLERGPLARRLLEALGREASAPRLHEVWSELAECLAGGRLFLP